MKKRLLSFYAVLLLIGIVSTPACQDDVLDVNENQDTVSHELKRGGKKTDVDQADLYGDLWQMERDNSGVPILYELKYRTDYQDNLVEGIIDVVNPRLDGSFTINALVRDADGYVTYEPSSNPEDDQIPITVSLTFVLDENFVDPESVIALYDAEGEILPEVAACVVPLEFGRLDIIRSPATVIEKRLAEVIKNFGDGTVANVTRDFCGRIMMFRTDAAIEEGAEDKPIDSPLENLAIYKELLLNGFTKSAEDNGLKFLIEEELGLGGFNFQFRFDHNWDAGAQPYSYLTNYGDECQLLMNLAAACISAGSDKSNTLNIDEIVFVNLFMGIPEVIGTGIDMPASQVNCFLPTIEQKIRMMDKTDKHEYSRYRYYVDYSSFEYDRRKFQETLLDYVTIVGDYDPDTGALIGSHIEVLKDNMVLHNILMGLEPLTQDAINIYRYTDKEDQPTTGALGFACQADDYVQALEVVHNNEEFLVWEKLTPIWVHNMPITWGSFSPFNFVPEEESHGNKPDGKGDDTESDEGDGGSSGGKGKGGRR
ncbi:hypothetical protein DWB61_15150 [Ancylomarina euxinus]|uniref:Uncharacterized protein n=1 Tax=Ancylomarina euxinus TaxID=2283627 RepID=A0A425XXU6_9BACT|nr:hypothetical protein [Ancylomarina euxinus]MCZ4696053.1 hypothetical protein [Ancylomarina euxinus]MUP13992.1 hypothetical protein [Ancylomarina euxinus]RRG19546.1 hypothetical protein DWB61_15150 [Ancylomarina euxinus]